MTLLGNNGWTITKIKVLHCPNILQYFGSINFTFKLSWFATCQTMWTSLYVLLVSSYLGLFSASFVAWSSIVFQCWGANTTFCKNFSVWLEFKWDVQGDRGHLALDFVDMVLQVHPFTMPYMPSFHLPKLLANWNESQQNPKWHSCTVWPITSLGWL